MFALEQIKAAHSKVESVANFPTHINGIKQFGVTGYQACISDGPMVKTTLKLQLLQSTTT